MSVVRCFTVFLVLCTALVAAQVTQHPTVDITPIPMEKLNPRLTEFRRIDANDDDQLTFSEFLLGDRPYIEDQSRYFHSLDLNSDGRVTRKEFEDFFRKRDEDRERRQAQSEGFFKQLGSEIYDPEESSRLASHGPPFLFHFSPQALFNNPRLPPLNHPNHPANGPKRPDTPTTPHPRYQQH